MLAEELKKVKKNKYKFDCAGVILFCPANGVFYKIAFGSGGNEVERGCDRYLYLTEDKYDDDGEFVEDFDGGQLDFNSKKDYTGYINDKKMIRDALEFLDCPDIDNCIFIRQYE